MREYSIFDIIGPVMIGPSSSHTAGAAKIGYLAREIAGADFLKVEFFLHGSFAKTLKGHGTDRALLAGVLGVRPDDPRLRDAYELAEAAGLEYAFYEADLGHVHPNTVMIRLYYKDHTTEITGSSIGGGNIVIVKIDDLVLEYTMERPLMVLEYEDRVGVIGRVTTFLAERGYNIEAVRTMKQGAMMSLLLETNKEILPEHLVEIRGKDTFSRVLYIGKEKRV